MAQKCSTWDFGAMTRFSRRCQGKRCSGHLSCSVQRSKRQTDWVSQHKGRTSQRTPQPCQPWSVKVFSFCCTQQDGVARKASDLVVRHAREQPAYSHYDTAHALTGSTQRPLTMRLRSTGLSASTCVSRAKGASACCLPRHSGCDVASIYGTATASASVKHRHVGCGHNMEQGSLHNLQEIARDCLWLICRS